MKNEGAGLTSRVLAFILFATESPAVWHGKQGGIPPTHPVHGFASALTKGFPMQPDGGLTRSAAESVGATSVM